MLGDRQEVRAGENQLGAIDAELKAMILDEIVEGE